MVIHKAGSKKTSVEAAKKVPLSRAKREFLIGLLAMGRPSTAQEVAEKSNTRLVPETIRKRSGELLNGGFIRIDGNRRCTQTNANATSFVLTEKGKQCLKKMA